MSRRTNFRRKLLWAVKLQILLQRLTRKTGPRSFFPCPTLGGLVEEVGGPHSLIAALEHQLVLFGKCRSLSHYTSRSSGQALLMVSFLNAAAKASWAAKTIPSYPIGCRPPSRLAMTRVTQLLAKAIWGLSNIPLPQSHPLAVPFADLSRSFAAQGKPTKASSDDDNSTYADTHYITLSPALSPCFRGSFATTEKH